MANPKKKTSKKADEADSDSQEKSDLDKKRELFQKAAGLLGYHPDESDRDCIYPGPQGFDPENIIED